MAKILIIEDDPLIGRLYEKIFKFENYEVKLATSKEESFGILKFFDPAIILLDIILADQSGLDVLEELKANSETKSIPVVILTSLSDKIYVKDALAKGAEQYIVKSDKDPKEVLKMINKLITK
ncbi:PleD family two-component system response regulator [Patescibacteria group bacterium]